MNIEYISVEPNKNLTSYMKNHEAKYTRKIETEKFTLIRLDGHDFRNYAKNFDKPYSKDLDVAFESAAKEVMKFFPISFSYYHSDEISFLIAPNQLNAELTIDKIMSQIVSLFTIHFNHIIRKNVNKIDFAFFDARLISLTEKEIAPYFIWRQKYNIKNVLFSEILNHSSNAFIEDKEMKDLFFLAKLKGIYLDDMPNVKKHGTAIYKKDISDFISTLYTDRNLSIFTIEYLHNLLS